MSSRKKQKSPPPSNPPPPPPRPTPPLLLLPPPRLLLILALTFLLVFTLTLFNLWKRGRPTPLSTTTQPTTKIDDTHLYPTYATSTACRECHQKEYQAWSTSHHGLAERPPDPTLDRPAFHPERTFTHASQKTTVRESADNHYEIQTLGYTEKP